MRDLCQIIQVEIDCSKPTDFPFYEFIHSFTNDYYLNVTHKYSSLVHIYVKNKKYSNNLWIINVMNIEEENIITI